MVGRVAVTRAVAQVDQLAGDPLDPDVGVLGAELAGPLSAASASVASGRRAELVVHVALRVSGDLSRHDHEPDRVAATAAGAAY